MTRVTRVPVDFDLPQRVGPMTVTEIVAGVLLAATYAALDRGDETEALLDGSLRCDLMAISMGPRWFDLGTPKVLTGRELELVVKKLRGEA